jgi:hypothetical protein
MFGVGQGTVPLVTSRVLKAVFSERFRAASLQWPSEEKKEEAKRWIEGRTCAAWRDGWLMVDGTLIPLFRRPQFYGNTWFDRKSNYSINVQVRASATTHRDDGDLTMFNSLFQHPIARLWIML